MTNINPFSPLSSINPATLSHDRGVDNVKGSLDAICDSDPRYETTDTGTAAVDICEGLRECNISPVDYSVEAYCAEYGLTAFTALLDEYDRDPQIAFSVTEHGTNLHIEDANHRHILLSAENAMHLAQTIIGTLAGRIDRTRPSAAA